ncbi:MAG: glycosyltransferase family 4 protein [Acidimicrobiia bacterium]
MRIGLICPYSLTLPGGVQGQVLSLARALRERGHDVRVLGPCDGPPPDAGVTPLGDSLPTAVNGSVAPIAPDPSAQLRTIRALRDERFDIVNVHEPFAPGVAQTAVVFKAQPLVGTFHAAGEIAAYRWLNPVVRWMARRLDARVAVSEEARAMAEAAVGGEYEVLFNGVELGSSGSPGLLSERATTPTVLFVARHEDRKGLAVLLEAMTELPPDVRLWVAGEGPQTAGVRARAAGDPRIEWLGRISESEKLRRLRTAQVFCAPSLGGESFGVVLLEAMAAGAAVVGPGIPGDARVARPGRDALLVPPGDAPALAEALRRVLDDGELRASLVDSGRTRTTEFSMDRLAGHYEDIFERVLRRR